MKVKLLVFSAPVDETSLEASSPVFYHFLKTNHVELEFLSWDGRLQSLPSNELAIVAAARRLPAAKSWDELTWDKLGCRCGILGHLCFYNDRYVSSDGLENERGAECLIEFAEKFLHRKSNEIIQSAPQRR